MERKIKYTDEPIEKVKVVDDFLPSPEELSLKEETVKAGKKLEKNVVKCSKRKRGCGNPQPPLALVPSARIERATPGLGSLRPYL